VQLDAVANLEAKTGNHAIDSILAYRRSGDGAALHTLYSGDGSLSDIQLDGSQLRQIEMQPPCIALGAIDAQGIHGLCWANLGVQTFDLDDLSSSWKSRILVPTSPTSFEALMSPTIAPDGKHFAALHRVGSGLPTAINIYAVDTSLTVANLVATITLPGLHARRLLWSPDGKWLAFTTDETTDAGVAGATYGFQLASILPKLAVLSTPQSQPRQVGLSRTYLTELEKGINPINTWRPTDTSVIWTYAEGGTIWQLDVTTGERTAILTIPDGEICALSWTPDGKQLIFAQCRLAGIAQSPPARLYLYTPPAG
jgi:WD40 repeat protein